MLPHGSRPAGDRGPSRPHPARIAGTGVLVLVLAAGCATGSSGPPRASLPRPDVHPMLAGAPIPAPQAPVQDAPPAQPLWTAPFTSSPQPAGDMFVGLVHPSPSEPKLTVAGVDRTGTTRWEVRTNPACAGFGITRSGDRLLAVVLFSDADARGGKLATTTTASAFDVRTGEQAWGPVEVSGSLRGPGLTFGESRGERMVLSSGDGRVVAREGRDVVPRYEHHGTALVENRGTLEAVDSGGGKPLWSAQDRTPPESAASKAGGRRATPEFCSAAGASDADVVALDWKGADGRTLGSSLHDLRTGRQLADLGAQTEVTTHVDEAAGVIVTESPGASGRITAVDRRTGAHLWQRPAHESGLSLTNTSGGVGYGTDDGGTVHIDLRTGRPLARGDWSVPEAVSSAGQMLVENAAAETTPYVAFSVPGRSG